LIAKIRLLHTNIEYEVVVLPEFVDQNDTVTWLAIRLLLMFVKLRVIEWLITALFTKEITWLVEENSVETKERDK
jgi:hypothetical protein